MARPGLKWLRWNCNAYSEFVRPWCAMSLSSSMRVSLESSFLSSQKSNQGSKKKEIHQNFTANPPSTFPNSWIDCKCHKKGETCRRRNTQKWKTVFLSNEKLTKCLLYRKEMEFGPDSRGKFIIRDVFNFELCTCFVISASLRLLVVVLVELALP